MDVNRDYQHLTGLRGCSPSFTLTAQQRGALGFYGIDFKRRMYPSERKGTYVQTVDRQGFSVVGLGRPSWFKSGEQDGYRKTGFLSTQDPVFLEDASKEDGGTSIFLSCKTIDQCFVDDFYYHGKVVSRRIYDDTKVQGRRMRDWEPQDAELCGSFGYQLDMDQSTVSCLGINSATHSCCKVHTFRLCSPR
jgi:hypothetical protein